MKLKSLFLVACSALVLCAGTSCHLFGKSKQKKKEDAAIAASVDADFRRRWVERRAAELTAQGAVSSAARDQAETEFREKYAFLKEEKK